MKVNLVAIFALTIAIIAVILAIGAFIYASTVGPIFKWNIVNGKSSDIAIVGDGNLYYYASTITSLTINRPNKNPTGEQLTINNQANTNDVIISGGAGVTISGQGRVPASSSTKFVWADANTLQQQTTS